MSLTNPIDIMQKATDLSSSLFNYIKENPKEGVATIVELLIPAGIAKLTKFAKLKKIKILSKSFKEGHKRRNWWKINYKFCISNS